VCQSRGYPPHVLLLFHAYLLPLIISHPTLDDDFFSIDAFNRITEEAEATKMSSGRLGDEDEEEEEEEEDLAGLMTGGGGALDDDEGVFGRLPLRSLAC
jgi:hypothetical protein